MNREVFRDELVTLFTTLIGPGQAQTVSGSKVDLEAACPVIFVKSAGSDRVRVSFTEDRGRFYFDVVVYVHQSGWTDAEATDMLDLLEYLISNVIDANRNSDYTINYVDRSIVKEDEIDGAAYYVETIPILVVVT